MSISKVDAVNLDKKVKSHKKTLNLEFFSKKKLCKLLICSLSYLYYIIFKYKSLIYILYNSILIKNFFLFSSHQCITEISFNIDSF